MHLLAVSIKITLGFETVYIRIYYCWVDPNLIEGIGMSDFARLEFEFYLLVDIRIKNNLLFFAVVCKLFYFLLVLRIDCL